MLEIDEAATTLKLLADPTRLTMLKLIEKEPCCVCEFTEIFSISQPAISQHIRKLKDANIIVEERRGQWIFFHLNEKSERYPFVLSILRQLPDQTYKLKEIEAAGKRLICE